MEHEHREKFNENPEIEIEQRKINTLIEKYREVLGGFEIAPVGERGFMLQSERLRPMAGNDWLMSDLDDVWVAYSEAKEERFELFKNLLKKDQGSNIQESDLRRIMDITDDFSRWEEKGQEGDSYHVAAHMSALSWATEKMKSVPADEAARIIDEIEKTLQDIRSGLQVGNEMVTDDDTHPFHFNEKRKLVLKHKTPWSSQIQNIFESSVLNPARYSEPIDAARELGKPEGSAHQTNIGIFTYGDPYFQLLKTFNVLEEYKDQGKDIPVSQIWLTKEPKGKFIEDLIKTGAAEKTHLAYAETDLPGVPEALKEREEMAYGSGYPLGKHPHVFVMLDDNPRELNSILAANEYLKEHSGASFTVVRSIRAGTKTEGQNWQVATKHGAVDFRSDTSEFSISTIAVINAYLELRRRSENVSPENKEFIEMKLENLVQELAKKGVSIENLAL